MRVLMTAGAVGGVWTFATELCRPPARHDPFGCAPLEAALAGCVLVLLKALHDPEPQTTFDERDGHGMVRRHA